MAKKRRNKEQRIKHVFDNVIKNINPKLYNTIYNEIINLKNINNQREIESYTSKKLNLKYANSKSVNYWICRGWSEKEAKTKRVIQKSNPSKSPMNINFWLNKINPETNNNYTKEEAEFKIKSQRKLNKEYWLVKGFNENDAIQKVKEYQFKQNQKYVTKQKENPELYKNRTTTQLNWWLKQGYTIDEAKQKLKERQTTFSKEICIEKYGKVEGLKRWKKRCNELGEYNKLSYYINKYGYKYGLIKFQNKIKNNKNNNKWYKSSNEAYKFFIPIYKYLRNNNFKISDIYWGVGSSSEYYLYNINNKKINYYDFTIPKLKLIIEYHGIMFHPNPNWKNNKWKNWKCLYNNISANEKYKIDNEKEQLAINNEFTLINVYSDENKINNLNNIINIIKELIDGKEK